MNNSQAGVCRFLPHVALAATSTSPLENRADMATIIM
jgi:hypothetical protein